MDEHRLTQESMRATDTEAARLAALLRYDVLDTPPEEAFDRIVRLAASVLHVPMTAISFVDDERLCFKARHGITNTSWPRAGSLCDATIAGAALMEIADLREDPVWAGHFCSATGPGLRFYAGAPIVTADGFPIGCLFAFDLVPRALGADQRRLLHDLAQVVADELELRLAGLRLATELQHRAHAENRLREREAYLRTAVESLPFEFWMCDVEGRYLLQNGTAVARWGHAIGLRPDETVTPPAHVAQRWVATNARALQGETVRYDDRVTLKGETLDLDTILAPVRDGEKIIGLVGINIDVTERRQTERRLALNEARLRDFLDTASDWLWETDADHRFAFISDPAASAGRYDPIAGVGMTRWEFASGDVVNDPFWRNHLAELEARRPLRGMIYPVTDPDGRTRHIEISGIPVIEADGSFVGYRGTGRIVTQRVEAEARIRTLADRDPLTGLANRRLLLDRLAADLAAERQGALFLLDLDDFKSVNDALGHDAGDDLLCQVARRIEGSLRQTDLVARFGGDEFGLLMGGPGEAGDAQAIAHKVLDRLREPFACGGQRLHVRGSIGVTLFPADGTDPVQLLKNADIALYAAKGQGRDTLSFFDPGLREDLDRKRLLAERLRQAIGAGDFFLLYQPLIRMVDGAHAGFEALLRWRTGHDEVLAPDAFLKVAEDSGIIVPLGKVILGLALEQVRAWLDAGLEPGQIAVNVAAAQLRSSDLATEVASLLHRNRIRSSRLTIEITEGVLLDRGAEQVARNLGELHALGVQIALDDFGTGHASLSHLKQFHVDWLKIDRSFIRDIGQDTEDAAIAVAIVGLAHSLGMRVVAEGVETEQQAFFLRAKACDLCQGFLYAPGLPAAEIPTYLIARAASQPTAAARPVVFSD